MDILKDKILEYFCKNNKKIDFWTLKKKLKINGEDEENLLKNVLYALEVEGKLYLDDNNYYHLFDIDKLNKIQGKLFISRKGCGYVNIENDKGQFNYLIHSEDLNGALSSDIVVLSDFKKLKSNYILAKIEKIVQRCHDKVILEYQDNGVFTPYNQKSKFTFITDDNLKGVVPGMRFLGQIDENNLGSNAEPIFKGHLLHLIGHKDDPKIDIKTIAYDYGFVIDFPPKVLEELRDIPDTVMEDEIKERRDLRDELIFTIDGDDTKDIDDAISLTKENDFYILKVSIADVAYYVQPGSALFSAAQERGTSAYLADAVLPMLPHELSNGICSLNPNVDRLAVTCEMKIDKNGQVIDYDIYESVINSKKQMTYQKVNSILEDGLVFDDYKPFMQNLKLMQELSAILDKKRKSRGNIDFASLDTKIKTDEIGNPLSIEARQQKTAEKIIENFMLMANETVATNFSYIGMPFVYRIHALPNADKFKEALEFLTTLNLIDEKLKTRLIAKLNDGQLYAYDVANLLSKLENEPSYIAISGMILKSMSKAIYSVNNEGHYALALANYTHFTSPIRRFPDLMVHTLIKKAQTFEDIDKLEEVLPSMCEHSSFMERQADKAEKVANELKMAQYMQKHLGEVFEGTVIACTRYGMTVLLDNSIKGRVDFEDILDGKYYYGNESHQLINASDHRKNYKVGDRIFVWVKEVSIPYCTINFKASKENILDSKPKVKRKHIING